MPQLQAAFLSFAFSTSTAGVAVRSRDGAEDYVSMPMRGRCFWHGGWAHDLQSLPEMAIENLRELRSRGWRFDRPGFLSQAWRQHDMCVTGREGQPLIPALGWRCEMATAQTARLMGLPTFAATVGPVEERFVAPKLLWAIEADPTLCDRIWRVMFSGDWFAAMLCDGWSMSASDALSNGLLAQDTKALAVDELGSAGLDTGWFSPVVPSDGIVGTVRKSEQPPWLDLTQMLADWNVVAFLGDNQATAAGCGGYRHDEIVISLGNSATVNRVCRPRVDLSGKSLRFDYWNDRLLLLMSDGATWYESFVGEPSAEKYEELNKLGLSADLQKVVRVAPPDSEEHGTTALDDLAWTEQLASVQFSIALEVLLNVKTMLTEILNAEESVTSFVLTGGLIRCPLLQFALREGLLMLVPNSTVVLNDREGSLAYKTDALGAIFNAMMAKRGDTDIKSVVEDHCPRANCDEPKPHIATGLRKLLSPYI